MDEGRISEQKVKFENWRKFTEIYRGQEMKKIWKIKRHRGKMRKSYINYKEVSEENENEGESIY